MIERVTRHGTADMEPVCICSYASPVCNHSGHCILDHVCEGNLDRTIPPSSTEIDTTYVSVLGAGPRALWKSKIDDNVRPSHGTTRLVTRLERRVESLIRGADAGGAGSLPSDLAAGSTTKGQFPLLTRPGPPRWPRPSTTSISFSCQRGPEHHSRARPMVTNAE